MSWKLVPGTEFPTYAAAWDDLQRTTTNTPFLESAFIQPLLQVFGTGRELLALHQEPSGLSAAVLVKPLGLGRWETFQPSQLPLGACVVPSSQDVGALAHSLLRVLPGFALSLGFTQLDPRLHPRPTPSKSTRLQDYVNTSFVNVEGSFGDYWEARGKNLRQNTRKQRNKLQTEGTETKLDCERDAKGVSAALELYGGLEGAGWKADNGTAIRADNDQGRFYSAMLQNFCATGRGRIYRYWFGDRVVAMDLCIDNGPMVVILKTAYDESLKQLSPSVLMRQNQFEGWWVEGRYSRIEFYGKTMEWHTRWTADERGLYHLTAYRWSWIADARTFAKSLRKPKSGDPA
jgi:CelD/BcsL family acetyltransferase involved in cellulose biosynthesis